MPTPKPRPDTNIKTAARASCNSSLSAQPTTIRSIRRPSKVVDIYGGGGRVSQATSSGLQGSSRWNPTAEQVKILEEWYNRGLHTPTALQIQYITCQLRFYGRIEGKNVFYWFQNHKARERQKLRRLLDMNLMIPSSLSTNSQETVRRGCNERRQRTPLPFNLSMQKDFLKLEPPSSCHEIETNRKDVMSSDSKKPVTLELFPTSASSDNLSCSSSFWRSNTTDENPRISNSRENDIDLEFRLSDGDSAHVKSFSSSFINIR